VNLRDAALCALLATACVISFAAAGPGRPPGTRPYAELDARPYAYNGPADDGEAVSPSGAIRIGLFVPRSGARARAGRSLLCGASLAVEEANAGMDPGDRPIALVIRDDDSVWGSAREAVDLAYGEEVSAIVGGIGGESTHVVQQIATKARLPLVAVASTDASLTQISIPWMFRLPPDDDAIARLLADHLGRERGLERVVSLTSLSYDYELRARAFEKHIAASGIRSFLSLRFRPGAPELTGLAAAVRRADPQAVVIWAGPEDGAALANLLSREVPGADCYAGPGCATPRFPALAGGAAEGVRIAAPFDIGFSGAVPGGFRERYRAAFGDDPDAVAAYAYEAILLLERAARKAGSGRVRLREALAGLAPLAGPTGPIRFDGTGANAAEPVLVTCRDGRFRSKPR